MATTSCKRGDILANMDTKDKKKTILYLSPSEARAWCIEAYTHLENLWLREMAFRDDAHKATAQTLSVMLHDRRRSANPHLKRMGELRQEDCALTGELLRFIGNMNKMFRGERHIPFEDEHISRDDARSWLASTRKRLKAKIRRERLYREQCQKRQEQLHASAATEEDSIRQQDIVLLLEELLKTYPPQRLPRTKG
jgi:hypothetical protein